MCDFKVKILEREEETPSRGKVSAVFLVAFDGGKILSARNERGWDIPGGHLEGEESFLEGLRREVFEEAGADFTNPVAYATIHAEWTDKIMLVFASDNFSLKAFTPAEDALERGVLEIEDLLSRYYGDKEMMRLLIEKAKERIG